MKRLRDVTSIVAGYDPDALPVALAQQVVARFVQVVDGVETVPIRSALGRVLASDIVSTLDVPAHDNSAMDGYALRGEDVAAGNATLRVIGSLHAGAGAFTGSLGHGTAVRIMTGAVMPAGADTVVPQEFTRAAGDLVTIEMAGIRPGDNRRLRGEDLAAGAVALARGRLVRPADLGLLASLGIADVPVHRRLRVAFFSTGDELRSIGQALDPGCVYDSNRYTLYGMLQRLNVEPIDMGVVKDDPASLESAMVEAARTADAIITSGGVSVGEADYTRRMMAQLGDVAFWRIAMRPGRPMAFGRIDGDGHGAILFGLPGNPVAVMVTFYFFVRDALLAMMGATAAPLPLAKARSAGAIRKKPGRTEYQRGFVAAAADGQLEVAVAGSQGSGVLSSMSQANCFVVLPHDSGSVRPGDPVHVLLFDGLV